MAVATAAVERKNGARVNANLGPSWAWGLALIALTIAAHASGVVMIALALTRLRTWIVGRRRSVPHPTLFAAIMVGAVGLLLALLHGMEAVIWAIAYVALGAFDSYRHALLYSFDSITTRGASGLLLDGEWALMGALEAANGMLLFGVSTAFVFAVIERVLPMILTPDRHQPPHQRRHS